LRYQHCCYDQPFPLLVAGAEIRSWLKVGFFPQNESDLLDALLDATNKYLDYLRHWLKDRFPREYALIRELHSEMERLLPGDTYTTASHIHNLIQETILRLRKKLSYADDLLTIQTSSDTPATATISASRERDAGSRAIDILTLLFHHWEYELLPSAAKRGAPFKRSWRADRFTLQVIRSAYIESWRARRAL
jgi:hypothetical protein